jgi:hypothetical protein
MISPSEKTELGTRGRIYCIDLFQDCKSHPDRSSRASEERFVQEME